MDSGLIFECRPTRLSVCPLGLRTWKLVSGFIYLGVAEMDLASPQQFFIITSCFKSSHTHEALRGSILLIESQTEANEEYTAQRAIEQSPAHSATNSQHMASFRLFTFALLVSLGDHLKAKGAAYLWLDHNEKCVCHP
eukprot:RCo037970